MSNTAPQEITPAVRELAEKIALVVDEKGVAKGSDTAYVDALSEGMVRHDAFAGFRKGLPKILNSDKTAEEKEEEIITSLAKHSEDFVRAKHDFDNEFFAAFGLSLGNAAREFHTANPEVNRVTGSVKEVGRNKFTGVYDHEYIKRIPSREAGKPMTEEKSFGRVHVSFDQVGNRKTAAQLLAVRQELADKATSGLAD